MEARALGLPLYCTKNLEQYSEGLVGYEDVAEAMCSARRTPKHRDDLKEYNAEMCELLGVEIPEDYVAIQ